MCKKFLFHKLKSKISGFFLSGFNIAIITIIILLTIFNISAVFIDGFSDVYRKSVFSIITLPLMIINNQISFSIGEILIVVFILICIIYLILFFLSLFNKNYFFKARKIAGRVLVLSLIYIYATETINCFVLYRCTPIKESLLLNSRVANADIRLNENEILTSENLINTYENIVKKANELALLVKHDENGNIIKPYSDSKLSKMCVKELKKLSNEFEGLDGYYPEPKAMMFSEIMCQAYLLGIYFPFTMEANYNGMIYDCNKPATFCHELSHVKGYILEDEANFIAYLACIKSDDIYIQYSGYLSVLGYFINNVIETDYFNRQDVVVPCDIVENDNIFVKKEIMKDVENDSFVSTDIVSNATDTFLNTNLKINGVDEGTISYGEVVKLILIYEYTKDFTHK